MDFWLLNDCLRTIFDVQLQEWAKKHKAHPNIDFRYADYRDAEGLYDRVYSIGMFEHVGRKSFATYFDKV